MKYKIGDKILIVSYRTNDMNNDGRMDKYLNKIMTIKENEYGNSFNYKMEEDCGDFYGNGWFWDDDMIESVVDI